MSKSDTARVHYQMARSEIVERIRLRDNVFLIYLGAISALFGIAFGISNYQSILLVIPYLSLGASIIISQHQEVIGTLGNFLVNELGLFMANQCEDAPQWDNSQALKGHLKKSVWLRTSGHLTLIILPAIFSLYLNMTHGFYSAFPLGPVWWFGFIFTITSVWIIINSYRMRLAIPR